MGGHGRGWDHSAAWHPDDAGGIRLDVFDELQAIFDQLVGTDPLEISFTERLFD